MTTNPDEQKYRFNSVVKTANEKYGTSEADYYEKVVIPANAKHWKGTLKDIINSQWMSRLDKEALLPQLNKSVDKDSRPGVTILRGMLSEQNKAKKEAEKEEDDTDDLYAEDALAYLRETTMDNCQIKSNEIIFAKGAPWLVTNNKWTPTDPDDVRAVVKTALREVRKDEIKRYNVMAPLIVSVPTLKSVTTAIYDDLRGNNAINIRGDDVLSLTRRLPMVINNLTNEIWFNPLSGMKTIKPYDLTNYFTFGTNVHYDPTATCPRFDKALDRIFENHTEPDWTIAYLFELLGYFLQPTRKKALFGLWKGSGSNGKTFVVAIISAMMGDSVLSLSANGDTSPHFTASLVGKTLIIEPDFDADILPDGMIKKYSEGKLETANPKFGNTYQFRLSTSMLYLTNRWPKTKDMSAGIIRRAQVIDFNATIPDDEVDHGLEDYIIEHELPGVLNRCIKGLIRLIKNGYVFTESEDCRLAKERWIAGSNPMRAYLYERCVVKPGTKVKGSELYSDYKNYLSFVGGRAKGRNQFYIDLENMKGIVLRAKDNAKWFFGLELMSDLEPIEDDEDFET